MVKRREKNLVNKFKEFKPTEIQQTAIDKFNASTNSYFLLGMGVGLGKTFTAWKISQQYDKVVVCCPAIVKEQWEELYDNVYTYESLDRKTSKKRLAFEKHEDYFLILDEVHENKRYDRGCADLILRNKHKTVKILGLSGTPRANMYEDFFTQLEMLYNDEPYNQRRRHKKTFTDRYTLTEYDVSLRRNILIAYRNIDELNEIQKSISYQNFETPTKWVKEVFEVPVEQSKEIKQLKTKHIYKDEPFFTPSAEHSLVNCLEHGWDYDEILSWNTINVLLDLYKKHKKVVVVYKYDLSLSILYDLFENVYVQNGKYKEYKQFDEQDEGILFAQELSYKQGLNLPRTQHQIFLDVPGNLEMDIQLCGRISRVDSLSDTSYFYYIAHSRNKIDRLLYMEESNYKVFEN